MMAILCINVSQAQRQSLALWYTQPAKTWEATLPLGNGRLGMTPDGGVEKENIVLNDITLWSGAEQDANNYDAHKYLPQIRELLFEGKMKRRKNWSMNISFASAPVRAARSGDAFRCSEILI